jgi:PTS system mannitol-specific IIC component
MTVSSYDYSSVQKIIFACDAGLGSSAMGASLLRNKLKKVNRSDITVSNIAISNLPTEAQIIFTHRDLTERAQEKQPNAMHISIDNFLDNPRYDEVVTELTAQKETENTSEIIKLENIHFSSSPQTKEGAIEEAGHILVKRGYVNEHYVLKMHEREKLASTYMGNMLAIPHGTDDSKTEVYQSGISIIIYDKPIK